ncbi:MAG: GNAT family N-acetyltransferase [Chloroflexi bacterium]|nr:GNAT family N-acetyltransferase [Chloroflexota bacterium]
MTGIKARGYTSSQDWERILEFICQVRANRPHSDHLGDYLWAVRVPAPEPEEHIHIWEDQAGEMVAFAMVHMYWQSLQYEILPSRRTLPLEQQVVAWCAERLEILGQQHQPGWQVYASAPEADAQRIALLEAAGFVLAETYAWHMVRTLREPVPDPALPPGFMVRPLADESEAAAYVAAHRDAWQPGSTMTEALHLRLMRMAGFRPELNLVAIAPDGTFAATMIGWLDAVNKSVEIEPLGTRPAFRRLGLARGMIREALRRYQAIGAETAEVWGVSRNPAAQSLYAGEGFQRTGKVLDLVKKSPQHPAG